MRSSLAMPDKNPGASHNLFSSLLCQEEEKGQISFICGILSDKYEGEQDRSPTLCGYSGVATFRAHLVDNDPQTRKERNISP